MTHVEQFAAIATKAQGSLIIPTIKQMPKVRNLLIRQIHLCDMAGAVARDGGWLNDYIYELMELNSAIVKALTIFHDEQCNGV